MSFQNILKIIYQYIFILIIIFLSLYIGSLVILRFNLPYSHQNKITRHSQDIFSPHPVFIECHSGVNREVFQNTLQSFSKAIEYNIESLETDVWLTKDKVLVLIHCNGNGEIDKYLNHKGNIKNLNWDQLSNYRTIKDNLPIPRLKDLMLLAKNKIFVNLEIKDPRVNLVFPYIISLIEEFDFFNQISISSMYHGYFKKIEEYNKKNNRKLIFGFIYLKKSKKKLDYSKKGHTLNLYWKEITKEICYKAHQNGMAVLAWFIMEEDDNLENYKKLIEIGVDIICCNYPVIAKKYRDSLIRAKFFSFKNLNILENFKMIFY